MIHARLHPRPLTSAPGRGPRLPSARLVALALGLALSLTGCSELADVRTSSGRTTFQAGETVVVQVFDRGKPVTAASLGSVRLRWSVRHEGDGSGPVDLGYGAELITSQLKPGKNWVGVDIENDPTYTLPPYGGEILITVVGSAQPASSTPSLEVDDPPGPSAASQPEPSAAPAPAAAASASSGGASANPQRGLVGTLSGN